MKIEVHPNALDDAVLASLEWHALNMLSEDYDKFETLDNKARLFTSFCEVIGYYSTKKQYQSFIDRVKGGSLK